MDNIDRIMKEADRNGFGVSYGKYQAARLNSGLASVPVSQRPSQNEASEKLCRRCQKAFIPRHRNQAYCTPECQYRIKIQRQDAWRKSKTERPPLIASCAICGANFQAKRCTSRYCSQECAKQGEKINIARWRAEHKKGDS